MKAQICETCVHKHDRCYCSPNSTCDKYKKIQMVEKKSWEEFKCLHYMLSLSLVMEE